MKVKKERLEYKKVYFREIGIGDVFEEGGALYMRIDNVLGQMYHTVFNAVCLFDGKYQHFTSDRKVRKDYGYYQEVREEK